MKQRHLGKYGPAIILFAFLIFSMNAWNQSAETRHNATDTIPKTDKKIKNIDDVIIELDKATIELEKIDWNKMKKEIEEATKKIDVTKMKIQLENELKQIDAQKIKSDVEKAISEIDMQKLKIELQASLAKVDVEKIKSDIQKIKTEDLQKIEIELKNIKPEIERSLNEAKVEIELAKKELSEYRNFISSLENDGLINKKDGYTIEHRKGELIINGQKQSSEVYNKNKDFLDKHKSFKIRQTDNDFIIDKD